MTHSISSIMNFNMFGIPVTGPETCGLHGQITNETDVMCGRWIQLASFYPFARFNTDESSGKEPYKLNKV
jgi:alpha-glucosidase